MECKETDCAVTRRPLRNWAGVAAIVFLTEFFAVAAPLRCQTPSGKVSDPFAGLQRSLEVAANEQLGRFQTGQLVANTVPGVTNDARPAGGAFSLSPRDNVLSGRMSSAEQRFQLLGVDAGRVFREEGVPVALLRMAQVESNWKPFALSPKGAFGLWQLMPGTARGYGLRVDSMRDDRADMDKSTRAAARYLRDLHLQFGDWALALAAYNAGESAVQKAMKRGRSDDFGNLSRRKLLPAETRAYVPAVLAAVEPFRTERTMTIGRRLNDNVFAPRIVYAAETVGTPKGEGEQREELNFNVLSAR